MSSLGASPIAAMFSGHRRRSAASPPARSLAVFGAKGGVGVSTFSALLASHLGRQGEPVLLIDLAGDLEVVLGLSPQPGPGISEWLQLQAEPAADALSRLEREVAPGLFHIGRGAASLTGDHLHRLIAALAADERSVIVDCGNIRFLGDPSDAAQDLQVRLAVVRQLQARWLVTRDCFVALHAAQNLPVPFEGVVLCHEPGRVLTPTDVSNALGAPVVIALEVDQAIFRIIDSGLMLGRPPRGLDRALDGALAALR